MGPENRFIQRVHRHLPKAVYREKMHNAYRGGTPDVWYSGRGGDAWVEYKWGRGKLSPLQLKWLTDRYAEGRKVFVVVGEGKGATLLSCPQEWRGEEEGAFFPTVQDLVREIESWCL